MPLDDKGGRCTNKKLQITRRSQNGYGYLMFGPLADHREGTPMSSYGSSPTKRGEVQGRPPQTRKKSEASLAEIGEKRRVGCPGPPRRQDGTKGMGETLANGKGV